jgi:hypothetical protein
MADLENGLFTGVNVKNNQNVPTITDRFFTTVVKGGPGLWALRGANSASTSLNTYYSGARPNADGYDPMSKEGAIILGIGGDNSISGQGTFYEGVMTSGYPSDAIENEVAADIAAQHYAVTSLVSGPAITVDSSVSLRLTTPGYTDRYLAHSGTTVNTQVISSASSYTAKQQASWTVRTGLGNSDCISFESRDIPGSFLHHTAFVLRVDTASGQKQFNEDATFCPQEALNGKGNSIRSWNYPTRYIRHFENQGFVATNSGPDAFDAAGSYNDDVSFAIGASLG